LFWLSLLFGAGVLWQFDVFGYRVKVEPTKPPVIRKGWEPEVKRAR